MADARSIIDAANHLRATERAAREAEERAAEASAEHQAAVTAAREARELADLASRVSMVVDEIPIERSWTADADGARTYRIVNLTDERRWADHIEWRGGYRVWLRRSGDHYNVAPIDVADEQAAIAIGVDWVLSRR
jgi:hypothetical protein